MRETLIYLEGGVDCLFTKERTKTEINLIKKEAKESGHIGYLSGYRYYDNKSDTVIVFFKEKPTEFDIQRRRNNGFKAAKWHYIN